MIFVVDVTDGARMAVARDELSGILASKGDQLDRIVD